MGQLERVERAMLDGEWHTLAELSKRLRIGEACLSAHIRSLRKPKHGGRTVERAYMEGDKGRCHHYRLAVPLPIFDVEAAVQSIVYAVLERTVLPQTLQLTRSLARHRADEIFGAR
jgi:hypothetical protein